MTKTISIAVKNGQPGHSPRDQYCRQQVKIQFLRKQEPKVHGSSAQPSFFSQNRKKLDHAEYERKATTTKQGHLILSSVFVPRSTSGFLQNTQSIKLLTSGRRQTCPVLRRYRTTPSPRGTAPSTGTTSTYSPTSRSRSSAAVP